MQKTAAMALGWGDLEKQKAYRSRFPKKGRQSLEKAKHRDSCLLAPLLKCSHGNPSGATAFSPPLRFTSSAAVRLDCPCLLCPRRRALTATALAAAAVSRNKLCALFGRLTYLLTYSLTYFYSDVLGVMDVAAGQPLGIVEPSQPLTVCSQVSSSDQTWHEGEGEGEGRG